MKSYNFPFAEIQEFFKDNLEQKLRSFFASYDNEVFSQMIKKVDRENLKIEIFKDSYQVGESDFIVFTFEKYISVQLKKIIYDSLDLINDGIKICFESEQSIHGYFEKIERQFQIILKSDLIKKYPFLMDELGIINSEINFYKKIDGTTQENESLKDSIFKPKIIERSFFHKVYDIAIIYELISDDFPREDFLQILRGDKTSKNLTFIAKNPLIITFFKGLEKYFENLNATSIGKSKRFKTKNNNLLTREIFYTTLNRIKESNKINELLEDLENLN